jgi:putative dimethyl sulfoxide reductase chaperone
MDIHTMITGEMARQQIYKSLAQCFQVPDKILAAHLNRLSDGLKTLESRTRDDVQKTLDDPACLSDMEGLKKEFSRLFIGPYALPAPPYGSVYIEKTRKTMGDSTMDVLKRYQALGVELADDFRDLPDHISAELEFMFLLIYKEIEGIRSDDSELVHRMMVHQRSFLNHHLNNWVPQFTDIVIEHADGQFYQLLARTTQIFLGEDHEYLEKILMAVD